MKSKYRSYWWIIFLAIVAVLIILLALYGIQWPKSMLTTRNTGQTLSTSSAEHLFATDQSDPQNIKVTLDRHDGQFYLFDSVDEANGGGVQEITQLMPDGHFNLIWEGQDAPPCKLMNDKYVPRDIATICNDGTARIDR